MKTTLFAALAAVGLALATPAAFAGSQSYPEGPAQTIVASPSTSTGYAEAYPDNGAAVAPLSAATALDSTGSQREPEFAGAAATYGATSPAVAQTPAAHING